MPVTTCIITGEGLFPNNSAPPSGFIDAILTGYDTDGSIVAPVVQRAPLVSGGFSLSLWPNVRGRRDTYYEFRLTLPVSGSEPSRVQVIPLGQVKVPQAGTRTLVSLLDERDDSVSTAVYSSLQIALLAATNGRVFENAGLGYASAAVLVGDVFLAPFAGVLTLYKKTGVGAGVSLGPLFAQGLFSDGSAAAPSVGFGSDTDTGLFRPGNNQISFAAGGAALATLSSSGFAVDVPVTGLATMQDPYDPTPGRLAKTDPAGGIFGLGLITSAGLVLDFDDLSLPTGFRRFDATTVGTRPVGVSGSVGGYLHNTRITSQNLVQALMANNGLPVTWQRRCISGVWQPWYPVGNPVIGAVSQTGGQPTGALIEAGANANGFYRRFACGLQICWSVDRAYSTASFAIGSLWRSANSSWTYPAAFASGTAPVVSGDVDDQDAWLTAGAPSNISVGLRLMSAVSKGAALNARATAVGRWIV